MYQYDAIDRRLVNERVAQFRDQVRRWRSGALTEDEFRPLRLQNGLHIQRQAPMFRIAVPYGMLNSTQLRTLARVARQYDRGYGHFTTRHNLQLNWPKVEDVPDILAELAAVDMHAIQTAGNCVRNITTDPFAGVAADELIDPRPLAEILRQWSTFHPEFAFLPHKFKIAISGAREDRAVTWFHDIGLRLKRENDETGFTVIVGGGLGRTPIRGQVVREFLPWRHILGYCEAILRVYNRFGRRDNAFKARIKILVQALGVEEFTRQVEAEWAHGKDGPTTITQAEYDRVATHFAAPAYQASTVEDAAFAKHRQENTAFARWLERCTHPHRVAGYRAVTLSLKKHGAPPGDISSDQMDIVADLATHFSLGELRISHEQNIILADVREAHLYALWLTAKGAGLATPNIGLLTGTICCPGGDFCNLANAKSIPIANAIQQRFDDLDYLFDIGEIDLNISGCMNACGHHHLGHIGVLGVDRKNAEFYQVTLGGRQGNDARLGKVIGPAFPAEEMPEVVAKIIQIYVDHRHADERFIDTLDRIGTAPFKDRVYEGRAHGKAKTAAMEVARWRN